MASFCSIRVSGHYTAPLQLLRAPCDSYISVKLGGGDRILSAQSRLVFCPGSIRFGWFGPQHRLCVSSLRKTIERLILCEEEVMVYHRKTPIKATALSLENSCVKKACYLIFLLGLFWSNGIFHFDISQRLLVCLPVTTVEKERTCFKDAGASLPVGDMASDRAQRAWLPCYRAHQPSTWCHRSGSF